MALTPEQASMMAQVGRSFAIPTKELTQTDIKEYKATSIVQGITTALAAGIVQSIGQLAVRAAYPFTDFGQGAVGWTNENYITAAVAAVNAWASAFNAGAVPANAPTLAPTKVAVFYKFADTMANPVVTAVRFREGGQGATMKGTFMVQQPTQGNLEPDVYFSAPIVYQPNDVVYIEVYNTAAIPVGETIPFEAYIVERRGGNVS